MSDDTRRSDLPNGMVVLTRERPYADVTAVSISVRGGSRNEHESTVGAAHFMEHMFFQGTPTRPTAEAIFTPISARGGWLNAYTSFENINFQAVVRNADFGLALDTLADMLVNSLFAAERIDKERQVVLEELIRGKNEPRRYAVELFFRAVWDEHPARNLPIGSRETLNNSDRSVLMAFRGEHFLASNMFASVVGDQHHEDVAERIATAFSAMPTGPRPVYPTAPVPPAKRRLVEDMTSGRQAQVILGLPAPGADAADTYALDVLSATLGEVGRRLTTEIRDRRGLASGVGSSYSTLSDVGCWYAMVGTSPANVDTVLDLIRAEMVRIRQDGVTPAEVADAQSYIEGRTVLGLQTSIAYAQYLADREAIGVEPPLDEYLRRVASVTADDVARVANAYLDPDATTTVILRPA
ncbi:MAG: insulinase family protein [Chloroflexi bacterium]|nr:insulinase family protein [Chloroflexota bacterium]